MAYKQLTIQIQYQVKLIQDFLKSQSFKDQIGTQDISSEATPYKYGDQTLQEGLNLLTKCLVKIQDNLQIIDSANFDQKNQIYSPHLVNLTSWIQSNTVGNYQSIIQYSNALYILLTQIGINLGEKVPTNDEIKKLLKEFDGVKSITSDLVSLKELKTSLTEIKESAQSIERAQKVIKFVEDTQAIESTKDFIDNTKSKFDEMYSQAKTKTDDLIAKSGELLGVVGDSALIKEFSTAASKYETSLKFWLGFVMFSIVLLILNLIFLKCMITPISIPDDRIIEVVANALQRFLYLSPSIFLVTFAAKYYGHKDRMREIYMFKSISSKTVEAQLLIIKNNAVSDDVKNTFVANSLESIYQEPSKVDLKIIVNQSNENLFNLENMEKNFSMLEKFKTLFK